MCLEIKPYLTIKLRFLSWGSLDAVLYYLKLLILFLIHSKIMFILQITSQGDGIVCGCSVLLPGLLRLRSYVNTQRNNVISWIHQ